MLLGWVVGFVLCNMIVSGFKWDMKFRIMWLFSDWWHGRWVSWAITVNLTPASMRWQHVEFEKLCLLRSHGAFWSARGVETELSVTATALSGMLKNLTTRTQLGLSVQCRCCCPQREMSCLRSHWADFAPAIKSSIFLHWDCVVMTEKSQMYITSKVHR